MVEKAQRALHSRSVFDLVRHRTDQYNSRRHLRIQHIQHVRVKQLGSTHAHVLRVHSRLVVLRQREILQQHQGHDRLLSRPLLEASLAHIHSVSVRLGRLVQLDQVRAIQIQGLRLSLVGRVDRMAHGSLVDGSYTSVRCIQDLDYSWITQRGNFKNMLYSCPINMPLFFREYFLISISHRSGKRGALR